MIVGVVDCCIYIIYNYYYILKFCLILVFFVDVLVLEGDIFDLYVKLLFIWSWLVRNVILLLIIGYMRVELWLFYKNK